ncbi:MAG: SpoIID/LytB domain-containing protein [Bacteriovoracaceae bacterium]|nr:SpoIID/LytB domain-containing protein [Bacteriovoracaceae bacterium]
MTHKLVNYFQLIFLLLFFSWAWQVQANDFSFANNSPEFRGDLPGLVDIDQKQMMNSKTMRVLVFPHTLKRDGQHGTPDDASTVTFISTEAMNLTGDSGLLMNPKKFTLKIDNGEFVIETATGDLGLEPGELKLTGTAPILVERKENVGKSHQYLGTFEIIKDQKDIKVINLVDIETYLRGVVPSESVSTWPIESLKAQSVAARTYALYHFTTAPSTRPYHVDDTARFQVYTGLTNIKDSTDQAVKETDSEVMLYKGKLIVAYFHAYSGGRTDSAKNIFKQDNVPYCVGNKEVFTRDELRAELPTSAHWVVEWTTDLWTPEFLIDAFKKSDSTRGRFSTFDNTAGLDFRVLDWNTDFSSIKTIQAKQRTKTADMNFTEIRRAIGWSKFPAYHFRLLKEDDGFKFRGNGWGHHVGMSQWGAMMMAKHHGADHKTILHHYYSGIEITKL